MAANYPSNDPSNASLLIAANNVSSTLNGGISAVAAAATLASTVHFPASGGITIESEAILYTANDTATGVLTLGTRGADSTTAAVHADGTAVYMHMQARHHNQVKDEIIAIGSDLRNCFDSDLDDAANVSTTAATLEGRLDQFATRIAALGNSTDWKTGFPGKTIQVVGTTTTTGFSTTSNSFSSTNLSGSITPQTITSKILIQVSGNIRSNAIASGSVFLSIYRGTTNLGPSTGFCGIVSNIVGNLNVPSSIVFLDSASTTAATTYTVVIRNDDGATAVTFGNSGQVQSMVLTEVSA